MIAIAHALLALTSILTALAVGGGLYRVGGLDAETAVLCGFAWFCAACVLHGIFAAAFMSKVRPVESKATKRKIAELEERISLLSEALDGAKERLARHESLIAQANARAEDATEKAVAAIRARPAVTPQPVGEGQMIAALVDQLGRVLDSRLGQAGIGPGPTPRPEDLLLRTVREAMEENRIELHLQPIVSLPQRRTAFYEGFTRLKDPKGRVLHPAEFLPVAERGGFISAIDNLLLFRCVQIVRRLAQKDRRIGIFCNLSAYSLEDESFFPQFLEFMRDNRDLAGSIIFEIGQDAFEARSATAARAMQRLADLGFRFSIDKVARLDVGLADLERAGVRFLKCEGQTLAEAFVSGVRPVSNIMREITPRDVSAVFARHGIDLIAEKIEDEDTVIQVLEIDAPYGQGRLFGPPRPIKDSLAEETAPPADFLRRAQAG
jgi:cyclic-di-GMP phosphodiesterase, flagellum assembly factor TipF